MAIVQRSAQGIALLLAVSASLGCGASDSSMPYVSSTATRNEDVRVVTKVFVRANQPIAIVERSTDDDFLFVLDRTGEIILVDRNGNTIDTALDIRDSTTTDAERGLLGLAFLRDDADTWWGFINYTDLAGDTVIAGYKSTDQGTFIPATRHELMVISQPYPNHNGGAVEAAPDGSLLIATGDGGSANDPDRTAQNLSSPLGKILRIYPWSTPTAAYSIPSDNPFINTDNALPEIWVYGLRNPWRFEINGNDLWIADVGQNKFEEINHVSPPNDSLAGRGANFGWSAYEANTRFNDDQVAPDHTHPVFSYPHDQGRCSVVGGTVVHQQLPELSNWYLFGDFCSGRIYGLAPNQYSEAITLSDSLGKLVAIDSTSSGVFAIDLDGRVLQIKTAD